jgi:hypothetical protein
MSVANIIEVYNRATPAELRAGHRWYVDASEESVARLRLPLVTSCGVVAALSPQCPWDRNIRLAEQLVRGRRPGTTKDRVRKARAILKGKDPFDALKGNKERAFFECLLVPDVTRSVCVDGHAYAIWRGLRITTSKTPKISDRLYGAIAADYRTAAGILGVRPHQCQAVTWLVWRAAKHLGTPQLPLF